MPGEKSTALVSASDSFPHCVFVVARDYYIFHSIFLFINEKSLFCEGSRTAPGGLSGGPVEPPGTWGGLGWQPSGAATARSLIDWTIRPLQSSQFPSGLDAPRLARRVMMW